MSEEVIKILNLKKLYLRRRKEPIEAISSITLDIKAGEFLSIVGPSGCGKSTMLKIIAGLLPYSGGEIYMKGERINGPRRDIGIVFQEPVLLPWKNVLDNVLLPISILNYDIKGYKSRAVELLRLVGLEGFEDRYPMELSGGMQQRVAIARALIHDPSLLLMDEPFGALDAMTRENMNLELLRIWTESKKTIFFITHSIPEAVFLSDRVVVLSSRPSKIIDLVSINLGRPRLLDFMTTNEFGGYTKRIRKELS